MTAKELYRQAYRDARILSFYYPPQYPVSNTLPLRFKLAARQSIEALPTRGERYVWTAPARQHHFDLLTCPSLQY